MQLHYRKYGDHVAEHLNDKLKTFQKIDNNYVLLNGHRKQRRKKKRISNLILLESKQETR